MGHCRLAVIIIHLRLCLIETEQPIVIYVTQMQLIWTLIWGNHTHLMQSHFIRGHPQDDYMLVQLYVLVMMVLPGDQ